MKEIHFHKDGKDFPIEEYNYNSNLHIFHNSTMEAIMRDDLYIETAAISALDFELLINKGYRIVLHENGLCGEIHEGITYLTDKEIRKGHDIRKIWIGGGFYDYFYK